MIGRLSRLRAAAVAVLMLGRALPTAAEPSCLPYPYDAPGQPQAVLLASLEDVFDAFPSLPEALDGARPKLCLTDTLPGAQGATNAAGTRITLLETNPLPLQRAVLIHELRHLDQLATGACPSPDLSMQETARATMAMEADASAVTALAAWYLRETGDGSVWAALVAWPTQTDIAAAFETVMEGGTIAEATSAAFDQWYASDWRRESYYLAACSDYLDAQDRTKRLPRYQLLPDDFLTSLCRLPDGSAYACAMPEGVLRP